MTTPLSIVLTTRNDGARLETFFQKLDNNIEVIVVDRSSSDNTIDVATRNNACVIRRQEPTSLMECYRVGTETATNEWVMYLSPGECLSDGTIDVLSGLLTMSPPELSGWLVPVAYSEISSCNNANQKTPELRIVRTEDVIWDEWVRESGLPRVEHDTSTLPEGLEITIYSECISAIASAIDRIDVESSEQAGVLVSSNAPNSMITGFRIGAERFQQSYDDQDASTFAQGCIELFAEVMTHAKALEKRGWENDLFLPSAQSMASAWDAFFASLTESELRNVRERVAHAHELGATPRDCAVALEMATQFWGADPEVLCDLACRYFDAGDAQGALATAQMGLAIDAQHAGLLGVIRDLELVTNAETTHTSSPSRPSPSAHDRFHARPDANAMSEKH